MFHWIFAYYSIFWPLHVNRGITKAAQALHMTQPPLSRQLKELEEELGKQLLIRTSKKIILTEDGMLLRKRAEELIDLFEKMQAEWKTPDANLSGEVYIETRRNL